MSQLIITTDVSSIRPVFTEGSTENIKRYNQLKKLFENSKEYKIFAEPIAAGGQKIAWYTEFEGNIIPLRKLDEEEQEKAKGLLKTQLNKLYKTIIAIIDDDSTRKKLFELIDSVLEIPDFNDIYIIQNASGEKNFCIVRWGFINEDFNATQHLIANLVPLQVASIVIRTIKGNNKIATGEKIFIEINNKLQELTTNEKGKIFLEDVKLLNKITAYQKSEDNKRVYEQEYNVENDSELTFFIGNQSTPKQNVYIQAMDEKDNLLSDITLKIKYDEVEFSADTDTKGKIELGDLFVGTKVICSQIKNEKEINSIILEIKQGKSIYFVSVTKQKSKGRVSVKIVDEEQIAIPLAEIQAKFKNGTTKYYSADEKGIFTIEDIPYKEDVVFRQIVDKLPQYQQIIKFNEDKKQYEIRGKKVKNADDFSKLKITVVNINNEPISNLRVQIENGIKSYQQFTNKEGNVFFEKIDCSQKTTIKAENKGKKKTKEITCKSRETEEILKLGNKTGLLWLWILLGIIFITLLVVFIPKIKIPKAPLTHDTTQNVVVDTNKVIVVQGMQLTIKDVDEKNLANAEVKINFENKTFTQKSNSNGEIIFTELLDTNKTVTAIIAADNFGEQKFTFKITKKKTIILHEQSVEISEIALSCGTNIKSLGYHSTIKTFNMHRISGTFVLTYNMNRIPDDIIVYNGSLSNISADRIIYKSNKPEQFIHRRNISFNSEDSLITVEIQGGDTTLTQWDFTVACPK
ncbi:MAG: hypothetical protein U9Q83_10260 [Bacteroidota bacterium]|nr:hypothetical protein [Bacteroidota bacterium]